MAFTRLNTMSKTDSDNDTWAFSTTHDFLDERKKFVKDLKSRNDLFRLFIATGNVRDIDFVTKGLIKFEQGVDEDFVKEVVGSSDVFPTTHWNGLATGLAADDRFKTHEVTWIFKPVQIQVPAPTPIREPRKKREPVGFKGLDSIDDDDVCLNCGA